MNDPGKIILNNQNQRYAIRINKKHTKKLLRLNESLKFLPSKLYSIGIQNPVIQIYFAFYQARVAVPRLLLKKNFEIVHMKKVIFKTFV